MTDRLPDLTIDLDDKPPLAPHLSRRRRRRAIMTVLTAAGAVLVLAYALTAGSGTTAHPPRNDVAAPAPAPAQVPAPYPRLIVPAAAAAGDTLIVLAYRNPELCGPTELRIDGVTTPTTIIPNAANEASAYPQAFLSIQIPRATATGSHQIDLYGPMPSKGGILCGAVAEHQARIATAAIAIHRPATVR
jgi:hypothetical protein